MLDVSLNGEKSTPIEKNNGKNISSIQIDKIRDYDALLKEKLMRDALIEKLMAKQLNNDAKRQTENRRRNLQVLNQCKIQ